MAVAGDPQETAGQILLLRVRSCLAAGALGLVPGREEEEEEEELRSSCGTSGHQTWRRSKNQINNSQSPDSGRRVLSLPGIIARGLGDAWGSV